MNRLEAMSTLLTAADAGSLSAASRKLGVPLATVSRRVSDLETYLRAKLLIRTSRRLELTEAGRSYIAACREILEQVEYAERLASGEYMTPKGDIVVTAPIVFGRLHVLPVITEFLDAYPDINVRLVQTDRVANFTEDRVDIALRIGPLPDSGLLASRLGEVSRVVCASPDYLARHAPAPERPGDLTHHRCITFNGLFAPDRWTFQDGKKTETARINSRLIVSTAEAAIDAAASGLGITRVPGRSTSSTRARGWCPSKPGHSSTSRRIAYAGGWQCCPISDATPDGLAGTIQATCKLKGQVESVAPGNDPTRHSDVHRIPEMICMNTTQNM